MGPSCGGFTCNFAPFRLLSTIQDTWFAMPCPNSGVSTPAATFNVGVAGASIDGVEFALNCAAPAALPPPVSTAEAASAALRECLSAAPILASTAAACALAAAAGVTTAATSFGAASPAGPAASAARPPTGVVASSFADDDVPAAMAAPEGAAAKPRALAAIAAVALGGAAASVAAAVFAAALPSVAVIEDVAASVVALVAVAIGTPVAAPAAVRAAALAAEPVARWAAAPRHPAPPGGAPRAPPAGAVAPAVANVAAAPADADEEAVPLRLSVGRLWLGAAACAAMDTWFAPARTGGGAGGVATCTAAAGAPGLTPLADALAFTSVTGKPSPADDAAAAVAAAAETAAGGGGGGAVGGGAPATTWLASWASGSRTCGVAANCAVPPANAPLAPPARAAAILGAATAAGDAGGGEALPSGGKRPPLDSSCGTLAAAGLRTGLGPAACSAAEKSVELGLGCEASAGAGPLACAAATLIGACETAGVAFIPTEVCKRRARRGHRESWDRFLSGAAELQYQRRATEQPRALDPSQPAVHCARHAEPGRGTQCAMREPAIAQQYAEFRQHRGRRQDQHLRHHRLGRIDELRQKRQEEQQRLGIR